jgi:hypothetical protein
MNRAPYTVQMNADIGASTYRITRNDEFAVEELNSIKSRDGSIKFVGGGVNVKFPDRRWTFELNATQSQPSPIVANGHMLAPNGEVLRACTLTIHAHSVAATSATTTAPPVLPREALDSAQSPPTLPAQRATIVASTPSATSASASPAPARVAQSLSAAAIASDQERTNTTSDRRESDAELNPLATPTSSTDTTATTALPHTSRSEIDATSNAASQIASDSPKSDKTQQSAQNASLSDTNSQSVFGGIGQWFSDAFASLRSSMWSLLIVFLLAVVVTGIVQGLRERVIVFRDFDDLAICFIPFACCVVALFFTLFGAAKIVTWLLVATAVLVQLFIVVTTWRDNPSALPFAIAFAAKTTLSFFFIVNLFSFLFPMEKSASTEARVRRDALIWMAVLAPVIYRLVRFKTGRINPMELGVRRRYDT